MKAITLHEPWATLVAIGAKKIETRGWATRYRGPLAIHASRSRQAWHINVAWQEPFFTALRPIHRKLEDGRIGFCFPFGCVIAICRLIDCVLITPKNVPPDPERSFGDYTPGRYAWVLKDIKPLPEPVPVKGRQGLWEWNKLPEAGLWDNTI